MVGFHKGCLCQQTAACIYILKGQFRLNSQQFIRKKKILFSSSFGWQIQNSIMYPYKYSLKDAGSKNFWQVLRWHVVDMTLGSDAGQEVDEQGQDVEGLRSITVQDFLCMLEVQNLPFGFCRLVRESKQIWSDLHVLQKSSWDKNILESELTCIDSQQPFGVPVWDESMWQYSQEENHQRGHGMDIIAAKSLKLTTIQTVPQRIAPCIWSTGTEQFTLMETSNRNYTNNLNIHLTYK